MYPVTDKLLQSELGFRTCQWPSILCSKFAAWGPVTLLYCVVTLRSWLSRCTRISYTLPVRALHRWWYHNLTAHRHQNGHIVPKQVRMIPTSIQTLQSKNCIVWEHSLSGQVWTKCLTRPDTQVRYEEAALHCIGEAMVYDYGSHFT